MRTTEHNLDSLRRLIRGLQHLRGVNEDCSDVMAFTHYFRIIHAGFWSLILIITKKGPLQER